MLCGCLWLPMYRMKLLDFAMPLQDALLTEESERFEDSPAERVPRRMNSSEQGQGARLAEEEPN